MHPTSRSGSRASKPCRRRRANAGARPIVRRWTGVVDGAPPGPATSTGSAHSRIFELKPGRTPRQLAAPAHPGPIDWIMGLMARATAKLGPAALCTKSPSAPAKRCWKPRTSSATRRAIVRQRLQRGVAARQARSDEARRRRPLSERRTVHPLRGQERRHSGRHRTDLLPRRQQVAGHLAANLEKLEDPTDRHRAVAPILLDKQPSPWRPVVERFSLRYSPAATSLIRRRYGSAPP